MFLPKKKNYCEKREGKEWISCSSYNNAATTFTLLQ
jgi:hypothetical protein